MTTGGDDLDRLKAAMRAATPAPDPAARAAALARAGETFARRQETAGAARHNSERAGKAPAVLEGVGRMIAYMTSHRALLTASGLAIAGIGVMLALPQAERPIGGLPPLSETAPAAAPDAPGADGRGGGTTASRPAPAQGRDTAAPAAPSPSRRAIQNVATSAHSP